MKTIHDEFGISRDLHGANTIKQKVDLCDLVVKRHDGESGSEWGFLVTQFVNLVDLGPAASASPHEVGFDSKL